ncbi:MAG: enoyl-CoA hydratase [Thermodesulfobacteriota bacterium]
MTTPVLYEKIEAAALITLNRPEKRNAISEELLIHLYNRLEEADEDPAVRCVILTGAGDSFCAGLDLNRIVTDNLMDPRGDGRGLIEIVSSLKKPLVGAINGHAITGGFELALNCDFLIASENASFTDTHARMGIHPGWGMSYLLARAVGLRMAKQMSFTAEKINAERARELGLVNEVVPRGFLIPRCLEIARSIAMANPEMLVMYKSVIRREAHETLGAAVETEKKEFREFLQWAGALKA